MTIVDPFIIPIPKAYTQSKAEREYHERLIRTINQLRDRTGGGSDEIESTQNRDLYDSTAFAGFAATIDDPGQELVLHQHDEYQDNSVQICDLSHYHDESNYTQIINNEEHTIIQLPDGSYFQSISGDITTSGNQTLICTSALTVTLNDSPADGELVRTKATNGNVTIDGNGKNIDGESDYTIVVNYEAINTVYSALDDAWFII